MKTILLSLILFFSSVANSATYNLISNNNSFLLDIDTNAVYAQQDLGFLTEIIFEASSPSKPIAYIDIIDWGINDDIDLYDSNFNLLFELFSPTIIGGGTYPYISDLSWIVGYQLKEVATLDIYTVTAYAPTPPSGNVPEPGVLALLALGLLGLAINLNYRKKMI